MTDTDETPVEDVEADDATAVAEIPAPHKMELDIDVTEIGPCRKHVKIRVPRSDIEYHHDDLIQEFSGEAEVPGFRKGHVPAKLIEKRFKEELAQQVKQRVLVGSLEQMAEDHDLDPINEPDLDVESLDVPEEGDFVFEFDVEVRPTFDLPDYEKIEIERPKREITDDDVAEYKNEFLEQYAEFEPKDGPAEKGDHLVLTFEFSVDGKPLHRMADVDVELNEVLRFQDAELTGFDELFAGAEVGETKEAKFTVSSEAERVEMRGEEVDAVIAVMDVGTRSLPELDKDLLDRIGVESEEDLEEQIRATLQRQIEYEQRQSAREQVLEKITESADWDLPEKLVLQQTDNALRREILEMQQAGFTTQQIRARENQLRQQAVSSTRQALKEHFVLDRIATAENIETEPGDVDQEIFMMALQRGESPRRVRARLVKSGMIENLDAQIRERKAIDFVLSKTTFKDVEAPAPDREENVTAVSQAICGLQSGGGEEAEDEQDGGQDEG